MFDSTGSLIGSYEYDAWGNVQCFDGEGNALTDETDIVVVNPIRYRGYYYDAETGLYYISSRYYDPSVKRMLNSDDESLSAASLEALTDKNYFAYCDNNPVGREDGSGEYWHIVVGAVVGGTVGAITQAIDQGGIHNGRDLAKLALATVTGAVGGGLGASGLLGVFSGAAVDAFLTSTSNIVNSLIDGKPINWKLAIEDASVSAVTSLAVGSFYTKNTKKAVASASRSINKGKNKIVSGLKSTKTASKVKGTIKTGQKMIRQGRNTLNKVNAKGSIIGSFISGIVSTIKNFFIKSLLGRR